MGVVVLSQYDDSDYALALLERGSSGRAYLLKERVSRPDHLMAAIREVAHADALTLTPRAVEKHINAIFSKLPLEQPRNVHRRVTAVLLFLADQA